MSGGRDACGFRRVACVCRRDANARLRYGTALRGHGRQLHGELLISARISKMIFEKRFQNYAFSLDELSLAMIRAGPLIVIAELIAVLVLYGPRRIFIDVNMMKMAGVHRKCVNELYLTHLRSVDVVVVAAVAEAQRAAGRSRSMRSCCSARSSSSFRHLLRFSAAGTVISFCPKLPYPPGGRRWTSSATSSTFRTRTTSRGIPSAGDRMK